MSTLFKQDQGRLDTLIFRLVWISMCPTSLDVGTNMDGIFLDIGTNTRAVNKMVHLGRKGSKLLALL